jgi:hypothetical protein
VFGMLWMKQSTRHPSQIRPKANAVNGLAGWLCVRDEARRVRFPGIGHVCQSPPFQVSAA